MGTSERVLVTGGAGIIGSALALALHPRSRVRVVDNLSSGRISNLRPLLSNPGFDFTKGDLRLRSVIDKAATGVDVVYHMAASPYVMTAGDERHDRDLTFNTVVTHDLLEACRKHDVSKIIFASSSAVYGLADILPTPEFYGPLRPISLYGASKLACEGLISAYCHLYGIQSWVFRFANVVAPTSRRIGRTVISDFILKLLHDPTRLKVLGDGNQSKSYMHVSDCVEGMMFLQARSKDAFNLFNIGSTDTISVAEIARMTVSELGLKSTKISFTGGEQGWPGDVPRMHLDISKARNLGWRPRFSSTVSVRMSIVGQILALAGGAPRVRDVVPKSRQA